MEISPVLYDRLIRPNWFIKLYISNLIMGSFNFENKMVLDFGCGTGSICHMFTPKNYIGIDRDNSRISYAGRLHPGYNFTVLQEDCLPVSDNLIDYVLIISVLHHIPPEVLPGYMHQLRRVLKHNGKIIVIEPCFFNNSNFSNCCMSIFDRGKYIRNENEYLEIFTNNNFETNVLKRFSQLFFYSKLFFTATPL